MKQISGVFFDIIPFWIHAATPGLGLLQFFNFNSFRTKFFLGFLFFMGLSGPQYFNGYVITTGHGPIHTRALWFNNLMLVIFTLPVTVAGAVALFLDLTLARKNSRKDSGRHWWAMYEGFGHDPRNEEFYSIPYGLSEYFPTI